MAIQEIQAKSVLQKSGIPGAAYVINPYVGCVHGCVYCYAKFMRRFTGHADAWGAFLDVKQNAPALLRQQLRRRKTPVQGTIFLSSVTDPYLPAERKYALTRGILETLLEHQTAISILTKSDLALRDIDILRQFRQCSVGVSLMTADDAVARQFEPQAAPPSRRIQALRELREAGIRTYAFISPYIPAVSNFDQMFALTSPVIDEFGIEALNARCGWAGVAQTLRAAAPEKLDDCARRLRDGAYWDELDRHARACAADAHLDFMGLFQHSRSPRPYAAGDDTRSNKPAA